MMLKFKKILTFLMMSEIMLLAFVVTLSNNNVFPQIFGENLHNRTLEEITKQTSGFNNTAHIDVGNFPIAIDINQAEYTLYIVNSYTRTVSVISIDNNTKIEDITVGNRPTAIDIDYTTETVYVTNSFMTGTENIPYSQSGTVSVISGKNNTKIGEDIPVGNRPTAIAVNEHIDTVYVVNSDSNTVSVISTDNNTKIGEDIPVGDKPTAIDINEDTDTVYVANSGSNTVSVISGKNNNTNIGNITVGNRPTAIDIHNFTDTVYVLNSDSNTLSVVDGIANEVVVGITLLVNPFNSGYLECNELISPTSQYFYVFDRTECIATPNQGFEFVSWEENFKDKSTQVISVSQPVSFLESIKKFFNVKTEEPEAKLNITKFGSFTANFKELPPPVPTEFWLQSYVLVGTVIAGLSIPSIVGWIKSKMDARKLNYYHKKIASLDRDDDKLDENDIEPLNRLRSSILGAYSEGKLNEKHYINLVNNISMLYQEVFKKEIDSLNSLTNNEDKIKLLNKVQSDIEDAYSKENLTEKHYNLLKEKISEFGNTKKDNDR